MRLRFENYGIARNRMNDAFSLVELLVAMAIIAVLITIATYGISIVQRNSRDTRRKKILENAQMAFLDVETNLGYAPRCFGSMGRIGTAVESHGLGFFSGPIVGGNCTGEKVGEFYKVTFMVNGVRNTGCDGWISRETRAKDLSICFDPVKRIIGVKLEGTNAGHIISIN